MKDGILLKYLSFLVLVVVGVCCSYCNICTDDNDNSNVIIIIQFIDCSPIIGFSILKKKEKFIQ